MLRAIDAHVHLYPPEVNGDPLGWAETHGERHWALLCGRQRAGRPVQTFPAVGELLAAMDAAGIERAVLLGWYWETPGSCACQNRFYGECLRAHPDRLSAFATFHPAAGWEGVRAEMQRSREEGLRGLGELSPHAQGFGLADPVWNQALALAGEWRWPVNLHVTDPASRPFPGRIQTPLEDFPALADRFPGVTFILAHWGGLLPERLAARAIPPNIFYDTAASPLLYDPGVWRRMVAVVGAERILFGSDYPLNLYHRIDPAPNLARFAAEARAALLGPAQEPVLRGNIQRLLPGL